ncbi:helix-turn-helix transcriptional regulator [Anabaena lutea]|uniref:Transcriptional regulator n=1 Tax=Anabaena lutea FACHB-196 TaxID=2692881 RepID=A0ABR8FDM0_9NOST|nr:helix-turn-helix domain-containing protein [Anabaena lutea]MBD2568231.1 transcriptional regulator [Anabaena lutea FACHB-196]
MTKTNRPFTPDWVSPPGDTIADILEERNLTVEQLIEAVGYSSEFVNLLIKGEVSINEEIAIKLEQVIGFTADFWLRHEAQYQAGLPRLQKNNVNQK